MLSSLLFIPFSVCSSNWIIENDLYIEISVLSLYSSAPRLLLGSFFVRFCFQAFLRSPFSSGSVIHYLWWYHVCLILCYLYYLVLMLCIWRGKCFFTDWFWQVKTSYFIASYMNLEASTKEHLFVYRWLWNYCLFVGIMNGGLLFHHFAHRIYFNSAFNCS